MEPKVINYLHVKICDNIYEHDSFLLTQDAVLRKDDSNFTRCKRKVKIRGTKSIDSMLVHYIVKEFGISEFYRSSFVNYYLCAVQNLLIILSLTQRDLIDYRWNDRVYCMIRERCELDHALSWLSTLGGAFSALGDYYENCAEMAGKISVRQLELALRLDDPNIVTRCRLYFSLSLIQRHYFKLAKRIVYEEFSKAKSSVVVDERLVKMCKGIWSKLQYEHEVYRKSKKRLMI